jgi:hypothetical protein
MVPYGQRQRQQHPGEAALGDGTAAMHRRKMPPLPRHASRWKSLRRLRRGYLLRWFDPTTLSSICWISAIMISRVSTEPVGSHCAVRCVQAGGSRAAPTALMGTRIALGHQVSAIE